MESMGLHRMESTPFYLVSTRLTELQLVVQVEPFNRISSSRRNHFKRFVQSERLSSNFSMLYADAATSQDAPDSTAQCSSDVILHFFKSFSFSVCPLKFVGCKFYPSRVNRSVSQSNQNASIFEVIQLFDSHATAREAHRQNRHFEKNTLFAYGDNVVPSDASCICLSATGRR